MATGYFVPLNIHGLRPKIQEIADGLLIELSSRAHFDIVADYADPLSMAVIREVFGLPASRESDIRNWANSFFQLFDILPERELQREFDAILGEYTEFLLDLFSERRRAPGNDVVSMMVAAQRGEERLSDWDLLGATTLMLASGFEGPKTLIGNSFYALFAFPEQRSVLQEDPTSIGAAVDEFSRFEAPAQMATRTARENVEIEGTVIRAGEPIIALLGSANRDPETVRQSGHDRFRPTQGPQLRFRCRPPSLPRRGVDEARDRDRGVVPAARAPRRRGGNPVVSLEELTDQPRAANAAGDGRRGRGSFTGRAWFDAIGVSIPRQSRGVSHVN